MEEKEQQPIEEAKQENEEALQRENEQQSQQGSEEEQGDRKATASAEQEQQAQQAEKDAEALAERNAELENAIEKLNEEKEQLTERLMRLQAEYENYRKRTEKERIEERKYKVQDLAVDLLPVIDNFERALQTEVNDENKALYDGMKMVYDQLLEALKAHGVEAMEVVNKPFDPNFHHAVMQEENDSLEPNTIIEELQKGFLLKDKVIRPAMVKVNK